MTDELSQITSRVLALEALCERALTEPDATISDEQIDELTSLRARERELIRMEAARRRKTEDQTRKRADVRGIDRIRRALARA